MIAETRVRPCRARLRERFATSHGAIDTLSAIEFTIVDDDGTYGVGWASPATALTGQTLESIAGALTGPVTEALRRAPLEDSTTVLAAVAGSIEGQPAARAAADLAVHDLLARRRGVSMAALLGAPSARVHTDVTVSAADPAAMAAAAAVRVQAGFDTLKLKLGNGQDLARVLAVADAVGPGIALRLDANQAWSPPAAAALLETLDGRGVALEFVEQPVPADDLDGLRWVRERSPYPVMADESAGDGRGLRRLLEAGAADFVNLKLARLGGLRATIEAAALAHRAGVPCMVGSMLEMPGAVAASVLLAATLPWNRPHDLDAAWWLAPGESSGAVRYAPPEVATAG